MKADIVIVGTGVAGLFCALNLPKDKKIIMLSKKEMTKSDSFLAQGGICVLKNEADYESYFEDTMRAGHYENKQEAVEVMIRSSREIIDALVACGVNFEMENGNFIYTKEGAHSAKRILFHKDITGKEITRTLLNCVQRLSNVTILENTCMIDLLAASNKCYGILLRTPEGKIKPLYTQNTVLACGGIGGLYKHSTNYSHLTGDAVAVALRHGVELEHLDYIQIHPTTLYSEKTGRRFLISESVRGEGALLYNAAMERFVDELLPRDIVTAAIHEQMKKDHMPYVWLSMMTIPTEKIKSHFPNIYRHCLEEGYDVTRQCIPVVPAQHYYMGGIKVDLDSRTSMQQLYAVGETSCNGVHGANRLASNSLLESLVFAKRSACSIAQTPVKAPASFEPVVTDPEELDFYTNKQQLEAAYKAIILNAIEKARTLHTFH